MLIIPQNQPGGLLDFGTSSLCRGFNRRLNKQPNVRIGLQSPAVSCVKDSLRRQTLHHFLLHRVRFVGADVVAFLDQSPDSGDEAFQAFAFLVGVGGGDQRGEDGGAHGDQRPARPSDVQRGDVPVADGLLAGGLRADFGQGEGDFDETFFLAG